MPAHDWFRLPRVLFVWLYALFAVSAFTVIWLGRTLIERERAQAEQLRRQQLEQRAEQEVSALHAYLAEISERVARYAQQAVATTVPARSVLLLARSSDLWVHPPGRILYVPVRPRENEAALELYRNGEALEFHHQTSQAVEQYQQLAQSPQAPVRAGALLRLARVLVSAGRSREALAAYQQLATIPNVTVAGSPPELIARHARLRLLDHSHRQVEAAKLRNDLAAARWPLDRGKLEFFWNEVATQGLPAAMPLSEAAQDSYQIAMDDRSGQGHRTIWAADDAWFVLWRTGAAGRAVYITAGSSLLSTSPGFLVSLRDAEGRRIAGIDLNGRGAAVRGSAETGLPWTVAIARDLDNPFMPRRSPLLLSLLAVMFAFPAAGTYFIGRAVRKEMETARLQSDFVAAVSHEFRSPLTTIRSLSEMLDSGRILDQNRPQYYRTLVTESTRLQRLVETLLNFGSMESGHHRRRLEEVDASELVRQVASTFISSGRSIHIHGETHVAMCADPEAVAVAVRNLIDNAIRYSPAPEPVEVTITQQSSQVLISVKDHGPGVKPEEREAIFEKFVRGSAAADANVHGTGVGLAMVHHIAEAHHGKIVLESSIGKGSTFTLAIPLVKNA